GRWCHEVTGTQVEGCAAHAAPRALEVQHNRSARFEWCDVMALGRENTRWFVYSGVFVALAQGLFYSAGAVAPSLVVAPLVPLPLIFRLIFARQLNPDHEVSGLRVIVGSVISIVGACTVSIDTDLILDALSVPEPLASVRRWRI